MWEGIERRFRAAVPAVDFCSLRLVEERDEQLSVRRGVAQPPATPRAPSARAPGRVLD